MKRLLVTTALEETWEVDAPLLFLGEWCRAYNRKHIWSKMDAVVARPFGIEPAQKASDIDYVDELDQKQSVLFDFAKNIEEVQQLIYNKTLNNKK